MLPIGIHEKIQNSQIKNLILLIVKDLKCPAIDTPVSSLSLRSPLFAVASDRDSPHLASPGRASRQNHPVSRASLPEPKPAAEQPAAIVKTAITLLVLIGAT